MYLLIILINGERFNWSYFPDFYSLAEKQIKPVVVYHVYKEYKTELIYLEKVKTLCKKLRFLFACGIQGH